VDSPLRLDQRKRRCPHNPQQKQHEAGLILEGNGRLDYTLNSTTLGPTNGSSFSASIAPAPPQRVKNVDTVRDMVRLVRNGSVAIIGRE